jgi:hypothetical protein
MADDKNTTIALRRLTDMVEVRDESTDQTIMIPAGIEANRLSMALAGHKMRQKLVTLIEQWSERGVYVASAKDGTPIYRDITPGDVVAWVQAAEGIQRITSIAYGDGRNLLAGEDLRINDAVRNMLNAVAGIAGDKKVGGMSPSQFAKKINVRIVDKAIKEAKQAEEPEIVG